jgi:geranylgeranyl diphosphate synthase, type II
MTLELYLKEKAKLIEQELDRLIPEQQVPFNQLFRAARYSLLGGGKRLRPILTLATCEAFGGDEESAILPASALEMVHTYSMIHDDLPCMDNDDFRRGKPSLHKAFPEGHAVLAGDYLLTYAFEALAKAPRLSSQKKVALISLLAQNAGSKGMIAGQIMDIEAANRPVALDVLSRIHSYKTGALIATSIAFGALIADVSEPHQKTLNGYAQDIGLAFQIVDDILDVTACEQKRGGARSSDIANGKTTYVTLLGIERARETADKLLESALEHLTTLPLLTSRLADLAHRLVRRSR